MAASLMDFEPAKVPLREIIGMDTSGIETFYSEFQQLMQPMTGLFPGEWRDEVLELYYLRAPMLLIKRKAGYLNLGTGVAWLLAKQLYLPDEEVPALICSKSRLSAPEKLTLLAADLMVPASVHRHRREHNAAYWKLWQQLAGAGANPLQTKDKGAYRRAMGRPVK